MKYSFRILTVLLTVFFLMDSITVIIGQQANLDHLRRISENQQTWKHLMDDLDIRSSDSDKAFIDTLHLIFEKLKSSSFPTAVASLKNQKCVNDSQLYVHTLYSLTGSNASWARQSII